MRSALVVAFLLTACGGDDAADSTDADTADADDTDDTADADDTDDSDVVDDAPPPINVTLSGTVNEVGLGGEEPVGGVLIEAFEEGGTTPIAMGTSGADGAFSLQIVSTDGPFDGYFKATKAAMYLPTYLYPPAPLDDNQSGTPVIVLTSGTFNTLASFAGGGQQDGNGFIGIAIVDDALAPVAGATITSSPAGTVRYNDANGTPSSSATSTSADGRGYVFNVAPGSVTVGATKSGSTFASHAVQVRGDAITLTIVTE